MDVHGAAQMSEVERLRRGPVTKVAVLALAILVSGARRGCICSFRWVQSLPSTESEPATAALLLTQLRLPRTLLVLGYGAVLGMTGAALQAMFANPLASPDITGSSSGAALGAVAGSYWFGVTGPLALAACGAVGASLALAALFAVAGRRSETATLLLAGIAIALAAGAGTSLLLALAPSPFAFYDSFEWLMGSFVDRSLPQAAAALVPAAIACALLAGRSRALDMMALGE